MLDDDLLDGLRQALADAERQRDDALARARRCREDRLGELHRLRNIFSVIRIIARRTGDDAETVEDYRGTLDGRLSSYLGIQAALARDWSAGAGLALLVTGELLTFGLREGDRVELVGPDVSLDGRAAALVALAFHELASAAIATGRLADREGRLRVSWRLGETDHGHGLTIDWIESVAGLDEDAGGASSWAAWIEQAIAHQLAGAMTIESDAAGLHARLTLPASALSEVGSTSRKSGDDGRVAPNRAKRRMSIGPGGDRSRR